MGFLFLQVPLAKPDAFLARTLPAVRWILTRGFFLLWLALVGCAVSVIANRWDELVQPIHGLLATRNLALMWVTLIGLKVCHEMGHAYACKHFGGHVPEMGAYLIAFTPCAYVDATAAWGFSRKRERLYVSLAGVYVEMTIAALAVFVWALTGPSLVNAVAFEQGQIVQPGELLVELADLATEEQVAQARADLEACEIRRLAQEASNPATAQEEAQRAAASEQRCAVNWPDSPICP